MQRCALPFVWKAGESEVKGGELSYNFRPTNIRTLVEKPGLCSFDGIYLIDDRIDIEPVNQLCLEVDAYQWSSDLVNRMQREFYEEHGLTGKTPEQIDRYLDKRGLSVPDPTRITLPIVHIGQRFRFTGKFSVDCTVSILGWA